MGHEESEYKKVEKIIRKADERRYWPTPVLDKHQWEIRQILNQHFLIDGWVLLAGIGLSTFINPAGHRRYRDILQTSVLFAVITEPPRSTAVLLVVEPGDSGLESFLETEGIRWIYYSTLLSAVEFSEQVISILHQQSLSQIGERKPINSAELEVTRALLDESLFEFERHESQLSPNGESRRMWEDSPAILHEVALQRVRPHFRSELDETAERMILQSSVDLLIHGRGRFNRPLLAIEIDGKHHENPESKIKDKAKEKALNSFGIPLIRIAPREADFWNFYRNPKDRQRKKLFSKLLTSIAQAVSFQVMSSIHDQLEVNDARLQLHFRENKLAQTMFGREYVDLADEQRTAVNFSMAATALDDDYHMTVGLSNFERSRELEDLNERRSWPKELVSFAPEPVIFSNTDSGLWAETTFTFEATSTNIATPRIRLMRTERFDDELMRETISVCLIEATAEAVREQMRVIR